MNLEITNDGLGKARSFIAKMDVIETAGSGLFSFELFGFGSTADEAYTALVETAKAASLAVSTGALKALDKISEHELGTPVIGQRERNDAR